MEILDLERSEHPETWLNQIAECGWRAGPFLHAMLTEGRFHECCGEKAKVLLLADGEKLASFCTYAERDEIPDTALTPWLGFVCTCPDYRGRRLMGKLICRAKELARDDGYDTLWISTGETGLYEKYGAEYAMTLKDSRGEDSRIYRMDTYGFHGWKGADVKARFPGCPGIETPRDLYSALWHLWTRETCTPRMRKDWSTDNRTLGQCAITAFLAQDIFGGDVWGIPLKDGGFHCFNAVGDCVFDLTSEQFGGKELDYSLRYKQTREEHFARQEKKERYELLKETLREFTSRRPEPVQHSS